MVGGAGVVAVVVGVVGTGELAIVSLVVGGAVVVSDLKHQ